MARWEACIATKSQSILLTTLRSSFPLVVDNKSEASRKPEQLTRSKGSSFDWLYRFSDDGGYAQAAWNDLFAPVLLECSLLNNDSYIYVLTFGIRHLRKPLYIYKCLLFIVT
jgi:hypothetical protein